MEDLKNESKKIYTYLLKQLKLSEFKLRRVGGKIDLFFPSKDFFVYLDEYESFIFISLFIKKLTLTKTTSLLKTKFKLTKKKAFSKITNFMKKFSKTIK